MFESKIDRVILVFVTFFLTQLRPQAFVYRFVTFF